MKIAPYSLLNIFHIVIDGLFDSVPLLLSFIIISFDASAREAGIIISLSVTVSTLLGLSAKFFSRCLGLLTTLLFITALYGFGFLANAFSFHIAVTGICFIIASAGHSVFHNVSFSYLASHSDRLQLGRVMGNFTAIGDIGRIPFASLAGYMAAFTLMGIPGWRIICFIYGMGALLFSGCLGFSALHFKDGIEQSGLPVAETKKYLPSFSLLRNSRYALPLSANVLDAFSSDQIFAFLPFLFFVKSVDHLFIGTFVFAFTLGCFCGKIVCGRLVDLLGAQKVFIFAELLMALLLVILIIAYQPIIIAGTLLLLGIVTKGTVPVIQIIITERAKEKDQFDDIFAMSTFSRGVTNMITPLCFGFIASALSVIGVYFIMAIAALCAALALLMVRIRP